MWVDRAAPGVSLDRGDVITHIDGIETARWYAAVAPLLSVDGDNEHAKATVFARSEEYLGSGLDHFGPLLSVHRPEVALGIRRANGTTQEISARRLTTEEWEGFVGAARFDHDFSDPDAVRFETVGDDIGVLTIDTFVNYRTPVEPEARLRPFFEQMAREGRTSLVLDLRRNGGGSDGPPEWLLSQLLSEPVEVLTETRRRDVPLTADLRGAISTWDKSALAWDPADYEPAGSGLIRRTGQPPVVAEPSARGFGGRVFALTSPGNTSGVTHLLTALRRANRVTLVGERTGGAPTGATAGTLVFLTLPNTGMRLRVPLYRVVLPVEGPTRHGLDPDVAAPLTAEAFLAGRDPALEAALQAAQR